MKGTKQKKKSVLINNLLLLLATIFIVVVLSYVFGRMQRLQLCYIVFAVGIFLIAFAVKNIIIEIAVMMIRRKEKGKERAGNGNE